VKPRCFRAPTGSFELPKGARGVLVNHVAAGRLKRCETIREGLESAPQGLVDLLQGKNFGKMLIKVD
jgi:NADPH-dependent curcumin reductase CurA